MSPEMLDLVQFLAAAATGPLSAVLANSRTVRRRLARLTREVRELRERDAERVEGVAELRADALALRARVATGERRARRRWSYVSGALMALRGGR
ncbi:hypothetical protein LY474_40500 [Myxococcus stipitatus]|uniref:hypothetical protein n=1 Tax=Myxococcus stipitatus TaxID=83455 RepID=UPI001F17CC51|nr:hypothetical protein [Myxococcus stipitatus]MCE9674089.1 hypothetical protein [Myxococcus stipitatus]